MSNLNEIINFENYKVRMFGTKEKPLFAAKDICQILGIKNVSDVTSKLPEKYRSIIKCDTPGGTQDLIVITEPGVYRIMSRSNKPNAQPFQEFVYEEVMPSIRRTGEYKSQKIIEKLEAEKKQLEIENKQILEKHNKLEVHTIIQTEKLLIEQKDVISLKKKLVNCAPKNTFRHKFPNGPCLYIGIDPDCKFTKNKFGITENANDRFMTERTMIPQLKIKLILYTEHCALFEQIIKIKYRDRLELPSHEWIIEDTDSLVKSIKNLDRIIGFNSIEETELWKYNLEDPPDEYKNIPDKEDPWKETIKEKVTGNEGKLCTMMLADRLHQILPGYLCNADLITKNINAPKGQKFCNGFHQAYRELREFSKAARGLVKICDMCHSMETLAYQKIESKELTPDQIRKNPTLIAVEKDEKVCSMCKEVKNKSDFDSNRRKCQKCRSEKVVETLDKFRNNIEEEIKKLKEMDEEKREFKISKLYTKDQLQVIIKHLKLGRKSSEIKENLVIKVIEYFATQNN